MNCRATFLFGLLMAVACGPKAVPEKPEAPVDPPGPVNPPAADTTLTSGMEELDRLQPLFKDVIPDFSRVGYRWGDEEIPHLTEIIATLEAPSDGADAGSLIQKAIDGASGQGVILLKAGTYNVGGTLILNKSGIVLRGEGDGTKVVATGAVQRTLLKFGSSASRVLEGAAVPVIDEYVPLGAFSLGVADAASFAIGDRVVINRPGTAEWISDIRMDKIYTGSNPEVVQWTGPSFTMNWERIVTGIEGNRLYFENPVVMALDSRYPDSKGNWGYVQKCSQARISESGVEDIAFVSEYAAKGASYVSTVEDDENHGWTAVSVSNAEHCWVRGISSRYFGYSIVTLGTGAKNITVQDCHSYQPVSVITGSRRYAFNLSGGEMCLVMDCSCEYDRHQYVSGAKVPGPNVFYNCTSTNSHSDAGPHHRWATGTLFDCLTLDGQLYVQDRDSYGTGHGWAGANQVFWNCDAGEIVCQSPWTSAKNYCVGCTGTVKKAGRSYNNNVERPQGEFASHGTHVTSGTWFGATVTEKSLYMSQKKARAGKRAVPSM